MMRVKDILQSFKHGHGIHDDEPFIWETGLMKLTDATKEAYLALFREMQKGRVTTRHLFALKEWSLELLEDMVADGQVNVPTFLITSLGEIPLTPDTPLMTLLDAFIADADSEQPKVTTADWVQAIFLAELHATKLLIK